MTMLVVDHLAKTYGDAATGVEAIREISFDVREREFVCIVGPSGGGKTTLLRCLCGLHPTSGGSIQLHGRQVVEPPPEMAAVFQDYSRSLMPWFTVERNVELPLKNTIKDKGERARARRVGAATRSASTGSATATRGSCRAACSSASRSPAPSPTSRRSSSWTSRSRRSTRRRARAWRT